MKLKQLSIEIENSPGRLYGITKALGDAGINLTALTLAESSSLGKLRLLVSDLPAARRLLMKMLVSAKIEEVVAVEIPDIPGALSKLLHSLLEVQININYMYAYQSPDVNKAIMIFSFHDNDAAIKALQKIDANIKSAQSFDMHEKDD
ncbi:MAG: amino acid-binding protein [Proteobacteria bacterium]|nr:amino acid-binding protein [Pseudomonadota bacterium]